MECSVTDERFMSVLRAPRMVEKQESTEKRSLKVCKLSRWCFVLWSRKKFSRDALFKVFEDIPILAFDSQRGYLTPRSESNTERRFVEISADGKWWFGTLNLNWRNASTFFDFNTRSRVILERSWGQPCFFLLPQVCFFRTKLCSSSNSSFL